MLSICLSSVSCQDFSLYLALLLPPSHPCRTAYRIIIGFGTMISLETAVWCSALHTTNNMETRLGVAKLWVQPRYERSVGCLIRIRRGFGRTALNRRWGKGLHWGAQVFERKSWIEAKYNEGRRWSGLDERDWCGQRRDNENAAINKGAILEHHETIRKGCSATINEYRNVDLKLEEWAEITCCFFTGYIELLILRESNQSRNKIKQESAPRAPQVPSAPTRP